MSRQFFSTLDMLSHAGASLCLPAYHKRKHVPMHALGLDVGSSSIKAAILDLETNEIRDVIQVPFPSPLPDRPSGHFEIDADIVVERCRDMIQELTKKNRPQAIMLCGQHGGFTLIDRKGNRVSPYVSWRDTRTSEKSTISPHLTMREECAERLGTELICSVGNELAPGGTIALLFWMKQNERLPDEVTPIGIGEYVLLKLGGDRPVLEPTCAIGMLDFSTGKHSRLLHERVGLEGIFWPEIREYRQASGAITIDGKSIPMYPVLGDHQCALLGANLMERELSLNISTGSQVSLLVREPELSNHYQTRYFFDGFLLNTITHLPAGRSLNALVDLLTELPREMGFASDDPWNAINRLVANTPKTDLYSKLTFFPGPLGARGEISNISIENLRVGDLFRAAYENMAANYEVAADLLGATGKYDRIAFSGGLSQKVPILREEILSRFRCPFRLNEVVEETLAGLLRAAKVVCG